MLTIAKLSRWSIAYYNDTANAVGVAARDARCANGGLGEYYAEGDTRAPVWVCAGDGRAAAELVGLDDAARAGGEADTGVVGRWLDEGVAPSGECGRALGKGSVHGFDLTFCAPKSVSLLRALHPNDVTQKAVVNAHTAALAEALEYLADHAGYTRVHNPVTGDKDLVRLPGVVAIAYQHETSRAGDPHLHTHVIVPNRQARADGKLVSLDGTSLFHEARAAGVIYQATLRRELHRAIGVEWSPIDPATGMAEVAAIDPASITAWSQRASALRAWAAKNLVVVDPTAGPTPAQLAAAQKATRPGKPEQLAWTELRRLWREDPRGWTINRSAHEAARHARQARATRGVWSRSRLVEAAEQRGKAVLTRADLVELIGAQLPVDVEGDARSPRQVIEATVEQFGMRISGPRAAHQREGSQRFTLDKILATEARLLELVDAADERGQLYGLRDVDVAGLSADQARAVTNIAWLPWLVCPLSAPAGAGKTTSMRALRIGARHSGKRVLVVAPTGKAVDVAVREGAGDSGMTVAAALKALRDETLALDERTVVIVDEAAMVGATELRALLTATTAAGTKTVLVGDAHQLAPVKSCGGMFAQLCADLPWTQTLSQVWRMTDPGERAASLALREGGPAPVRRAVNWYAAHGRLRCGDPIAMATDALDAYRVDIVAGKDALLVCDTTEIADALNQRLHDDRLGARDPHAQAAPTVTAARGHQLAVEDLILTRRNTGDITVLAAADNTRRVDAPVRNGQRWQILAVDAAHDRIAARRLTDGARAAFSGDYLHQQVTHGYAVTVHSAQGVTADTTHAVLGERTSRALLYVAMTRGRESNTAYLYERHPGETAHEHRDQPGVHVLRRGTTSDAVQLVRAVIAHRGEAAHSAHHVATSTDPRQLPDIVRGLLLRRTHDLHARGRAYRAWHDQQLEVILEQRRWTEQHLHRARAHEHDRSYGLEL
ncbi:MULTISPECIES: MobF family relaxase [Mycobacterium]|nr:MULTISPECIES: MobF family relaxase [Mycobacterium]OBF24941.1 AAA family ATPase [Mycobacterium kubicae]